MNRRLLTIIAYFASALPAIAQEDLEHAVDKSLHGGGTIPAVEAGHATSGLPQFNPQYWPSQAFWLVICFGLFYLIFGRFVLPSLAKTVEFRREKISEDLRQAEHLSEQAQSIKEGYEAELKKAAQSASSSMKEIDDASKEKLNQALSQFRSRFETQVAETERQLNTVKSQAMADISKVAAEIAAQAAEKIAGVPADRNQAEAVVQDIQTKQQAA